MSKFHFLLIFIGFLTGIFSGMIGIGGGILMVPLFIYLLKYNQHKAQGLSLAVMLPPVTALAVWNYYKNTPLRWDWVLLVVLFFMIGNFLGAVLANKISQKKLKKIFGIIMLLVALKMIFENN